MRLASAVVVAVLGGGLVACAARQKSAEPATSSPAAQSPAASPQQQSFEAAPPPPAPGADSATAQPGAKPALQYAPPPGRASALAQASTDIEASQRELDVAGGDCRNACRALGSMDRAAGRICGLAQSDDEVRRCGDAKSRVYTAREKVKATCGQCPDVTVDRDAPVPSR